jgi:hypothetical protein
MEKQRVILQVGMQYHVMGMEEAITVTNILALSERFKKQGYGDAATYHIWEEAELPLEPSRAIHLLDDVTYNIGKLAGKPVAAL